MEHTEGEKQYQTSDVNSLVIGKAKKKEGFYVCPVKGSFVVCIDKASIISIKDTSNTLVIKSKDKQITRYMDDLNNKVLDIVRNNAQSWFNTHIDDDLIEEYYISTLQYDKKRGETIRLKVKNVDEIEEAKDMGDLVSIVVTFKYIKFFKQKFYPEFQVEIVEALEAEHNIDIIDEDEEVIFEHDDEHPLPSYDEVMSIKEECMKSLKKTCDDLANKLCEIEKLYNESFEKLTNLGNSDQLTEIIELCELYQN